MKPGNAGGSENELTGSAGSGNNSVTPAAERPVNTGDFSQLLPYTLSMAVGVLEEAFSCGSVWKTKETPAGQATVRNWKNSGKTAESSDKTNSPSIYTIWEGLFMEKIRWNRRRILSLVKGLLAAYAVTAGLLMLLALVILQLNVSEGTVAAGVMVIYLLSCFLGGFLLGKGVGKNKFLWGVILGAVYFVLLMILSAAAGSGSFAGSWENFFYLSAVLRRRDGRRDAGVIAQTFLQNEKAYDIMITQRENPESAGIGRERRLLTVHIRT